MFQDAQEMTMYNLEHFAVCSIVDDPNLIRVSTLWTVGYTAYMENQYNIRHSHIGRLSHSPQCHRVSVIVTSE